MIAYFYSKFTKQIHAAAAVLLLVVCLLGTNWIGLSHSIAHANPQSQSDQIASSAVTASSSHTSDVCHLFDALTLAGSISSSYLAELHNLEYLAQESQTKQSLIALQSIERYRSRAPPITLL